MTDDHYLRGELYELVRTEPALFEFLQEGSLDGLWYWDLESPEAEWMSPRFWQLFGVDPATKRHDPAEWQDRIHPEDLPVALENFHAHAADPSVPYDQVVRYRHEDGSTVWVRCRGLIIRDADGKPLRMLGAHNDLTELKRVEEQLRERIAELHEMRRELERSNRDLVRSNEALSQFAYVASHDLQEPLRMIASFSALLSRKYRDELDERADRWLAHIDGGASRMRELITGLLEWSRVQTKGERFKPVDLNVLVSEVRRDLMVVLAETDAVVEVSGPLPVVQGDPSQLRRVVQNLVENAVKFRRPEECPHVVLAAAESDGEWEVSVTDNGLGVAAEYHERIFEMFQRLHSREQIPGCGLGLALCRRIMDRHGGDLRVASPGLGQGSTFTIVLPRGA